MQGLVRLWLNLYNLPPHPHADRTGKGPQMTGQDSQETWGSESTYQHAAPDIHKLTLGLWRNSWYVGCTGPTGMGGRGEGLEW